MHLAVRLLVATAALALSMMPVCAGADPFDWSAAELRSWQPDRAPARARALTLRLGTTDAGGGMYRIAIESDATDEDGVVHTHTVVETMCEDRGWRFELEADGTLTAEHGACSRFEPEAVVVTRTWQWSQAGRRFVEVGLDEVSPWHDARDTMLAALDADDLSTARQVFELIGTTPNGGHTDHTDRFFEAFFVATHRRARAVAEAGHPDEAARLMLDLLDDPGLHSPMCQPDDDALTLVVTAPASGCAMFKSLPTTQAHIERVRELADLLDDGGHTARADAIREALP